MDIRLIFLNYLVVVIRCGGTQEDRHAAERKWLFKRGARMRREISVVVLM